jgi:hypothetical protein
MAKEHPSEDQRIAALEQTLPGIQRALDELRSAMNALSTWSGPGYAQPSSAPALFEQALALCRTINLMQAPAGEITDRPRDPSQAARFYMEELAQPPEGCPDCTDCTRYVFIDPRIEGTHTVVLEPTAQDGSGVLACLTLAKVKVIRGRAEAIVCCKRDKQGQIVPCVGQTRLSVRDPLRQVPSTGGQTIAAFILGEFITKSCGPLPNGGLF